MAHRFVLRLSVARVGPGQHALARRRAAASATAAAALPAGCWAARRLHRAPGPALRLRRYMRARLKRRMRTPAVITTMASPSVRSHHVDSST